MNLIENNLFVASPPHCNEWFDRKHSDTCKPFTRSENYCVLLTLPSFMYFSLVELNIFTAWGQHEKMSNQLGDSVLFFFFVSLYLTSKVHTSSCKNKLKKVYPRNFCYSLLKYSQLWVAKSSCKNKKYIHTTFVITYWNIVNYEWWKEKKKVNSCKSNCLLFTVNC